MPDPTAPSPPDGLNSALDRNIDAMEARRRKEMNEAPWSERAANAITAFAGSMMFVYIHLAIYGVWILINLGLVPGMPRFDSTFVLLAMEASVEAIFLSTFVLISQNRMAAMADKRADLDLHVNLLTEHELTKLAVLVSEIAERLGIESKAQPELDEIKRDVRPETVLDAIEAEQK
jgi:uncharacterized membrane protein